MICQLILGLAGCCSWPTQKPDQALHLLGLLTLFKVFSPQSFIVAIFSTLPFKAAICKLFLLFSAICHPTVSHCVHLYTAVIDRDSSTRAFVIITSLVIKIKRAYCIILLTIHLCICVAAFYFLQNSHQELKASLIFTLVSCPLLCHCLFFSS